MRFVNNIFSETIVNIGICVNSVILFMMYFGDEFYNKLLFLDHLMTIYFFLEVNFAIWKRKKDLKNGIGILEIIVVYICMIGIFIPACDVGILILIRLFRTFKCFRMIKIFPQFKKIIINLKIAFKTAIPVILGMILILFILDISLCHLYGKTCPEYFGNPWKGLYTTFRLFTIEGWYEVSEDLFSKNPGILGVVAMILIPGIVFICSILGLAFITSAFTDELCNDNDKRVLDKLNDLEKKLNELGKK